MCSQIGKQVEPTTWYVCTMHMPLPITRSWVQNISYMFVLGPHMPLDTFYLGIGNIGHGRANLFRCLAMTSRYCTLKFNVYAHSGTTRAIINTWTWSSCVYSTCVHIPHSIARDVPLNNLYLSISIFCQDLRLKCKYVRHQAQGILDCPTCPRQRTNFHYVMSWKVNQQSFPLAFP